MKLQKYWSVWVVVYLKVLLADLFSNGKVISLDLVKKLHHIVIYLITPRVYEIIYDL